MTEPLPIAVFHERVTREITARARVDVSTLTPDAHLVMEVGLSSLDLLNVLAFVEAHFHARFPDELLGTLTTLNKIEAAVRAHPADAPREVAR